MTPTFAWSLHDNASGDDLWVHMLLHDHYYGIATQWPEEEMRWFIRWFARIEEAHDFAVWHTQSLENNGDVLKYAPVMRMVRDHASYLDGLKDRDVVDTAIDNLFALVLSAGWVPDDTV